MHPRPILKSLWVPTSSTSDSPSPPPLPFASYPSASPHVHFPPTPVLVSTHAAYSPRTYDRAPIAVSPNYCALPERGARTLAPKGSYFHPRAFEACTPEPPALAHLSSASESDDADCGAGAPADASAPPPISVLRSPIPHARSQEEIHTALSFLPYPPAQDQPKAMRRGSTGRARARSTPRFTSAFQPPTLDGCLGGF